MTNITLEVLDGNKFYSAEDARGNLVTVFTFGEDTFVQTNNSPPRHIDDIAKLSQTARAILDHIKAEKPEIKTYGNPRYAAFVAAHGERPNHMYLDFILAMKKDFCGCEGGHIVDHAAFTRHIEARAKCYRTTDGEVQDIVL